MSVGRTAWVDTDCTGKEWWHRKGGSKSLTRIAIIKPLLPGWVPGYVVAAIRI